MKSIIKRFTIALLLTSLMSVAAFAKTKSETISFPTSIKINGTLVEKGVYDLKYDEQAGELTIIKEKKIIARSTTSVEKRDRKARVFEFRSSGKGDDAQLTRITFAGADHDVVIGNSQATR